MTFREDRSWMYNRFLPNKKDNTPEFVKGVQEFMEYVMNSDQYKLDREMRCPCKKCDCRKYLESDVVHEHILKNGFLANYWYWVNHGEHTPHYSNLRTGMLSNSRGTINKLCSTNENTVSKATDHNVKGKEPANGSCKWPLIDTTLNVTQPPSPTPLVYSPKSDSNDPPPSPMPANVNAHVGTPKSNESSMECGNGTFVQSRGQELVEQKFNGQWKSFKNVPVEKEFCGRDEDQLQVKKIFDTVSSDILKNKLLETKKSNKRPCWIGQTSWNDLNEECGKEHPQRACNQNKKNPSDCDGQVHPKHKMKHGCEPTVAEAFIPTHSSLNPEGACMWVGERSKKTRRLTEIAGGSSKGRVYSFGDVASQKFNKSNCHLQSEQEQVLINELNTLRSENQNLKNELAMTRAEFNSRMTYLEARFATFEQHMRFQSMQQYAAHYMPFTGTIPHMPPAAQVPYPPPAVQVPYPPRDGQPSLESHPSSHPPSDGTYIFVPTPQYPPYVPLHARTTKDNDKNRDD